MLRLFRSRWLRSSFRSLLLRVIRPRRRQSGKQRETDPDQGISEETENAIYRDLGRYVVRFQHHTGPVPEPRSTSSHGPWQLRDCAGN
jgi:hypothetical protein